MFFENRFIYKMRFSIELEKQASQTGLPTVKNIKQISCHPQQIHGTHFLPFTPPYFPLILF